MFQITKASIVFPDQDGKNNTVAASRWSCSLAADTAESVSSSAWFPTMCNLALQFDADVTISHLIVCERVCIWR